MIPLAFEEVLSTIAGPGLSPLDTRRDGGLRSQSRPANQFGPHFLCIFPLTTFESGFARDRRRPAERAPRVQRRARSRAFASDASKRIPGRGAPHARSPALEKSPPILWVWNPRAPSSNSPTASSSSASPTSCASRDATKPTSSRTSPRPIRAGSTPARPRPPCSPTAPSGSTSRKPKPTCASPPPGRRAAPDPPRHARRRAAPPHRHCQARPAPHPRQPGGRLEAGHPLLEAPGRGARGRVGAPSRCAGSHPEAARAPAHRSFPDERATSRRPDRRLLLRTPSRRSCPADSRGPRSCPVRAGLGRDEATGSSAELRPDGVGQFGVAPPRFPWQASSPSPPGATASSSPPAPGCATSSRGSRPSCAPPSPAPTSPPSSKTPSPRSSKGSRPAASVSRRPPARTSRRPGRSPPRATSPPPSAGPCTGETGAVVASSTNRADVARPATGFEFHHRHPVAMGGDHSPQGIALACKAHNLYLAEVDFGRAATARHRQSKHRAARAPRGKPGDAAGEP